jgi:FkbH-like protein
VEELRRLGASPDAAVRWLRLGDRHGDLGLVCVGIVRREGEDVCVLDTLLMSCRVMGRGVEDAFLSHLLEVAAGLGARRVRGIYRPTVRNHLVADFFPGRGFTEVARGDEEIVYEIDPAARPPWPAHIRRIDADGA